MLSRLFLLLTLIIITEISYAQKLNLDSIQSIANSKEDNERIDFFNTILKDYSCQYEGQSRKLFEAVNSEIQQANYPEGALMNFQNLGNFYYCFNNLDSAAWAFKQAVQVAKKHGFHKKLGRNSCNLGYLYQKIGNIDSSLFYFQKGLKYGEVSEDTVLIGAVSMGIGLIHLNRGLIDSAVQSFINSAKFAAIVGNKRLLLNSKLNIGTIYYTHQKSKIDINDYLEILALAREIEDFQTECSALVFLGYLKTDNKEYDQAINYFRKALKINSSYSKAEVYKGIAKIYDETEQYDSALYYIKKGITVSNSSNSKLVLPKLYTFSADIYIKLEKYKSAIFYALKAIETSTEIDQKEFIPNSYLILSKAYSNLGQFENAYDAHVKFHQLNTDILDTDKAKQIAEMETKYETELKEQEIQDLTTDSQIQKLQFGQQRLVFFLIIGAVIILALIILFIYFNNKSKAKQATIDFEQKLLRNQLNPHFIFNALGAVQNFMLKNDTPNAGIYLSKFAKLMRQILEHSREDYISMDEEIDMLTNYLDIQKARFQDSFNYSINIDPSIDTEVTTIPPMFAQPFLENAIEHGIAKLKGEGNIEILFSKTDNIIHLEIIDNGKGIAEASHENKKYKSLATIITKERMALFGSKVRKHLSFGFDNIKDSNGNISGTKVRLDMPCLIVG